MSEEEKREAFGSASGKDATEEGLGRRQEAPPRRSSRPARPATVPRPGRTPRAARPDGKAEGEGQGQGEGGVGRMMDPATLEKFKAASPDERRKMLEERGVPADRIDMILERMKSGGGGGGGGGGLGGGFGGGPGGPQP